MRTHWPLQSGYFVWSCARTPTSDATRTAATIALLWLGCIVIGRPSSSAGHNGEAWPPFRREAPPCYSPSSAFLAVSTSVIIRRPPGGANPWLGDSGGGHEHE